MKTAKLALLATATVAAMIALPATGHAGPTPACSNGQVIVTAGPPSHTNVLIRNGSK
jgi:hypothetical protein